MGTVMLAVSRIQFPQHYVREQKNQAIIKEWTADLKEKKQWYFPPLEVWVPKEGLAKDKTHELIDGHKRLSAALAAGLKQVPVTVLGFKQPVDAFARQYQANADNGEFMTRLQRNHYVRVMKTVFKLNLAAIAKITKLSKAQCSRIARGIKAVSRATSPKPGATFSARSFLDDLGNLCDSFNAREKTVLSFLKGKYGDGLTGKIAEALSDLTEALSEALKAVKEEAGQEA